jgi:membrane protease YdiL (CAAX protease family)
LLPWAWNELGGLALLVLAAAALAVAPYVWILPLHYAGILWARRRGGPRESRFGLRHLWLCSGALLIAWFLAAGFFRHSDIDASMGVQYWHTGASEGNGPKAFYLTGFSGMLFAFASAFLWRARAWELFRNESRPLRSLGYIAAALGATYAIRRLNLAVFPQDPDALRQELIEGGILGYVKACLEVWGLAPTLLLAAVAVPFYEEVLFRGVFLQSAGKYLPFWPVNILQAAAFSSLHDGWRNFPTYLAMGAILGWMARRTGGLLIPMLTHGLNNAIAITTIWTLLKYLPK